MMSMIAPQRLAALPPARLAPDSLPLMLPTLVDAVPAGAGWLFELKWDGVRVLALRRGGRVELWSRNGRSVGGGDWLGAGRHGHALHRTLD